MLIVAGLLALLVGISLGILGGGGSILSVPILRYVLGLEAHHAIAVSMLAVCATSVAALIPHARRGQVSMRVALGFGGPGMVGAYFAGRLTHLIPDSVLLIGLALLMLASALAMLHKRASAAPAASPGPLSLPKLAVLGMGVGAITGVLGAGGGFVVVPALWRFGKLPVRLAVGSSLVVVAMNAAAGFLGILGQVAIDGQVALVISASAVAGSVAGGLCARRIDPDALRKGFAWLVLGMASFMLMQEVFQHVATQPIHAGREHVSVEP